MQAEPTPEQYESILKYMEAANEEDFQTASLILKQHNYNLNTAINAKFSRNEVRQEGRHRNVRDNSIDQSDEEIVGKYIQHIRKTNENWSLLESTYSWLKSFTVGAFNLVSQILLPQCLLRRFLRSSFYIIYKDESLINFQDDKLVRLLMNTKDKSHKSCFLTISPIQKANSIARLLSNQDIAKQITTDFQFIGFVVGDSQINEIQNIRPPEIIICRYNIYEQKITLRRYVGEEQIQKIRVQDLKKLSKQGRNHQQKDKNVLIKYRNFVRRKYYGPMYIEEEEEDEINFQARHETTQEIITQNQEYKRIEQQEIQRLKQIQKAEEQKHIEKSKIQEIVEERKFRKMSIPDEPQQGEIIKFMFRCPDGSLKNRNFSKHEKVQILYNWVQTNEEIQLQDNDKRLFQILHSYPPTSLKEMKQKELKQVFDSEQQKLLIRQI